MPELIAPTTRLHKAWLAARDDWGPGVHEDGFGIEAGDEVDSAEGFASWVARLAGSSDPETPAAAGAFGCTFRWIVEGDEVLGGIALRRGDSDFNLRMGHIGYGIRPTARRRGLATWALGAMLEEARALGMDKVLIVCEADNEASAKTAERNGGVLEAVEDTEFGPVRRYWVHVQPNR